MNRSEFENRDPLADRLRQEALLERPGFSRELHERIVQRIREEKWIIDPVRSPWFGRRLAIAAAVLLVASIGAWMLRPRQLPGPPPSADNSQQAQVPALASADSPGVEIPGVLSARLWPPEIAFGPPVADATDSKPADEPATESRAPVDGPQWLIARLQTPAASADDALADLLPPDLGDLLGGLARMKENLR
jgi:hypothetical protein